MKKWIANRICGAKVKVLREYLPVHFYEHKHALVRILEPVIVYKWIYITTNSFGVRKTVRLRLPKGAKVVLHEKVSKCRADKAVYLGDKPGRSAHKPNFKYTPGRTVSAKLSSPKNGCGRGIHFCFNRNQVRKY